jgi:hypothetical protein
MFEGDTRVTPNVQRAWREAVKAYLGRPGVIGVAVGHRWKAGKRLASLCVRIHVDEKFRPRQLTSRERFPKKLAGVWLDVVDGRFTHQLANCPTYDQRTAHDPALQPGLSVGSDAGEVGTLGALVSDLEGNVFGLSALHVLYSSDQARNGDPVMQPGKPDGGRAGADTIGTLARYSRDYDAALALLDNKRPVNPQPLGGQSLQAIRLPRNGDILEKSGRTTCVTRAYVDAIGRYYNYAAAIHLRPLDDDQEATISASGDSGAVWYDAKTGEAIGLHVKGDGIPGGNALATLLAGSSKAPGALASLKVILVAPV